VLQIWITVSSTKESNRENGEAGNDFAISSRCPVRGERLPRHSDVRLGIGFLDAAKCVTGATDPASVSLDVDRLNGERLRDWLISGIDIRRLSDPTATRAIPAPLA
jgi:hypothetical protein